MMISVSYLHPLMDEVTKIVFPLFLFATNFKLADNILILSESGSLDLLFKELKSKSSMSSK